MLPSKYSPFRYNIFIPILNPIVRTLVICALIQEQFWILPGRMRGGLIFVVIYQWRNQEFFIEGFRKINYLYLCSSESSTKLFFFGVGKNTLICMLQYCRAHPESNRNESITNNLSTRSVKRTRRFQNTLPVHRYISSRVIYKHQIGHSKPSPEWPLKLRCEPLGSLKLSRNGIFSRVL